MTNKTKAIEEKFNKTLPQISQADLGVDKPRAFNKVKFVKAAEALQKILKDNDKHESAKA